MPCICAAYTRHKKKMTIINGETVMDIHSNNNRRISKRLILPNKYLLFTQTNSSKKSVPISSNFKSVAKKATSVIAKSNSEDEDFQTIKQIKHQKCASMRKQCHQKGQRNQRFKQPLHSQGHLRPYTTSSANATPEYDLYGVTFNFDLTKLLFIYTNGQPHY